jgi:shikimate kinase
LALYNLFVPPIGGIVSWFLVLTSHFVSLISIMKIYLIGFMGSGKTYWGKKLSQKLQLPFFDSDEQIVNSEGKSVNDIFEQNGEEYFRLKEKGILHIITESHSSFVMACGGGSPCYFNNIDYMNKSGTTVWLNTPLSILFQRLVQEKNERPLVKKLTDDQLRSFITKKFADRKIYYEQAEVVIDDEEISLDHFIEKIFHA